MLPQQCVDVGVRLAIRDLYSASLASLKNAIPSTCGTRIARGKYRIIAIPVSQKLDVKDSEIRLATGHLQGSLPLAALGASSYPYALSKARMRNGT